MSPNAGSECCGRQAVDGLNGRSGAWLVPGGCDHGEPLVRMLYSGGSVTVRLRYTDADGNTTSRGRKRFRNVAGQS